MSGDGAVSSYIIQFLVSDREYLKLYNRIQGNKVKNLSCLPLPETVSRSSHGKGHYPHVFVRNQSRLFIKTYAVLAGINGVAKLGALIQQRRGKPAGDRNLPALRMALSVTSISALYRVSYTILNRLKDKYSDQDNKGTRILVPALSGLIAGVGYGIYPKQAARAYIGLWVASKAAEYLYNYLEDEGYLEFKPRLLGSWALFPLAMSQLFYAFIFHPDCCPPTVSNILFRLSDGYIPDAPDSFVNSADWPSREEVVSSIAEISKKRYPNFVSPILFPETFTVPQGLEKIEPVVSMAHPAITTLTGALMHPYQRSEFRTYIELILRKFGSVSKYVFAAYLAVGLLKSKNTNGGKLSAVASSFGYSIRTTIFIVMTAASLWSGVGVTQKLFGKNMLPTSRYRVIGFTAGLWAFVDQVNGRARYLYTARLAVLSYWNMLVKQGRVRPHPQGDVALFAVSFGIIMALLDYAPGSVTGPGLRSKLAWLKHGESKDPVEALPEEKEKEL